MSERASVNAPDMSAYVRVLDALYGEPSVQERASSVGERAGGCTTHQTMVGGTAGLWFHDSIVNGAPGGIELFHGRTDSAIAAAAACATIDLYEREQLFERAARMAPIFENAIHKLRGERHVIDVRNLGLVGGAELAPRAGAPSARAHDVFVRCFEKGVLTRYTGDILAFSPPLIIEEAQIDEVFKTVAEV